jgi:mitochondrial fission protein ELM1
MKTAWIFCDDGKIGSLSQAKALADGLKLNSTIHILKRSIWRKFMPIEVGFLNINFFKSYVKEPYPDIVIGVGRLSVIPTLFLRKYCKTVFIQNPRVSPKYFDCVIAPHHDRLRGENVIEVIGALHNISPEKIKTIPKDNFSSEKDTIAVFIGGHSKHCVYTEEIIVNLCEKLLNLHAEGHSLLISTSRRTHKHHFNLIRLIMKDKAHYIWDLKEPNPYLSFLAAADKFIVTSDSISMMSELCSTGKPTYIYDVGIKKEKFQMFIKTLLMQGYAKILNENCPAYRPNILNQLPNCLELVKKALNL